MTLPLKTFWVAGAAALTLCTADARAGLGDQIEMLAAHDGAQGDEFGRAVAIGSTYAIITAREDTHTRSFGGSAYAFDVATGNLLFKFIPDDNADFDHFGTSAAISGSTALVGCVQDDDFGISSGSAYLFDIESRTQLFKLVPDDNAAGDYFGGAVAICGDIAIIGASSADGDGVIGSSSGAAYLFDITTGEQILKLLPDDAQAGDSFGGAVAISEHYAIVGATNDDDNGVSSGSAYIFDLSTGNQIHKLLADDGVINDIFGSSLAISGDLVAVGSPRNSALDDFSGAVYFFDAPSGNLIRKIFPSDGKKFDRFGDAIAITGDTLVVGCHNVDDNGSSSGSVYLFDTTSGTQLDKVYSDDIDLGDRFGVSVAAHAGIALVGADYNQAGAGAARTGSAYLIDVFRCASTDLNGDNQIDAADLGILLGQFNTAGPDADINGDGVVDAADLGILLGDFGTVCP